MIYACLPLIDFYSNKVHDVLFFFPLIHKSKNTCFFGMILIPRSSSIQNVDKCIYIYILLREENKHAVCIMHYSPASTGRPSDMDEKRGSEAVGVVASAGGWSALSVDCFSRSPTPYHNSSLYPC